MGGALFFFKGGGRYGECRSIKELNKTALEIHRCVHDVQQTVSQEWNSLVFHYWRGSFCLLYCGVLWRLHTGAHSFNQFGVSSTLESTFNVSPSSTPGTIFCTLEYISVESLIYFCLWNMNTVKVHAIKFSTISSCRFWVLWRKVFNIYCTRDPI